MTSTICAETVSDSVAGSAVASAAGEENATSTAVFSAPARKRIDKDASTQDCVGDLKRKATLVTSRGQGGGRGIVDCFLEEGGLSSQAMNQDKQSSRLRQHVYAVYQDAVPVVNKPQQCPRSAAEPCRLWRKKAG